MQHMWDVDRFSLFAYMCITARAEVEKGQTTAIITGAIAVILGVAYLILVQLLDSRGTTLVPPPPEAFGL